MTSIALLAIILTVVALAVLVAALAKVVRADGYGHRPPPVSHYPWSAGPEPR